jgi:protein TonB
MVLITYNLRKDYDGRMKKAMFGVLALVAGLFIFNYIEFSSLAKSGALTDNPPDIILKSVDLKEPDIPKPAELPKPKPATIQHTTPLIVNGDKVDPVPDITQLAKDVNIGTETIDGPPASIVQVQVDNSAGEGINTPPVEPPKEENKTLISAESMPEFPGGQAAFMRFLSKNLHVPENALDPGQKIKVLVRFVVGKDGELSNMEFLQTGGEVFEQEVLRVIKKMPKWKPGIQNGEKVRVYFNLPIIFDAPEE